MPWSTQKAPLILNAEQQEHLQELSQSRPAPQHRDRDMRLSYDGRQMHQQGLVHGRGGRVGWPVPPAKNSGHHSGSQGVGRFSGLHISQGSGNGSGTVDPERSGGVRSNTCRGGGSHPCLLKAAKATIHRILEGQTLKPHKITYYLERKDPEFDRKMRDALMVYQEVMLRTQTTAAGRPRFTVSVDEKPGVQPLATVSPDLPPVPGKHRTASRDYEHKRLGTASILAALDLQDGQVIAQVHRRHRSREFIELFKELDAYYPADATIRAVLDNHSAHISKETRDWLSSRPQPVRLCSYSKARILAQSGGNPVFQDESQVSQAYSCSVLGRTETAHPERCGGDQCQSRCALLEKFWFRNSKATHFLMKRSTSVVQAIEGQLEKRVG